MPKRKKRGTKSTTRKKTRKTSTTRKKTRKTRKSPAKSTRSKNLEKILIENFISFQKVMVNLSTKFEDLTKKISDLLELFEISAKTLAEKDIKYTRSEESKEIIEKMNLLLDQNKTIARGLTLMHDMASEPQEEKVQPPKSSTQYPSPKYPQPPPAYKKQIQDGGVSLGGYQKSIHIEEKVPESSMVEQTDQSQEEENEAKK